MHRFTTRALILSFCLVSLCAIAQENRVVRVGVATMQSQASQSLSGNWGQDRLVAALNQQKDKKQHIKLQGVPLEGTSPDEVGNEAKQKSCDYVVYANLVELQQSSGDNARQQQQQQQQQSRPGTMQPYPGGALGMPPNPNTSNAPGMGQGYRATVDYRLYRTGESSPVASAPVSGQQAAPAEAVVSQVLNQVANRVLADVKKAPPAAQQ